MNDSAPENTAPDPPPSGPLPEEGLHELQELLFGREKKQLSRIQERLENPALQARDVGNVLPQAVSLSGAQGDQLARALTPSVESALKQSIKRDPSVLVGAIFPIIGPAIRKSIAETFGKLVQSLNRTLEHSLSLRGFQWRMEAARTGKSFAEVVLAHTLVYRVEQVFLIHRKTSLLLQHASAAHEGTPDSDVISAMLSAIQDFVKDSFQVGSGESVQTLQVGEWNVWVDTGPQAMIAAVIRGQAPEEYRSTLQETLERIHAEQGEALASFDGNDAPFEAARGQLEDCLKVQFGSEAKPSSAKPIVAVAIVVIAVLVWGFFVMRGHRRWNEYVSTLRAEPGIVVTEATRGGGRYRVAGLRDPIAADPRQFLAVSKIDSNKIDFRWEPYQSLSPAMVVRRATSRLQPPHGVNLRFLDGVLYAEGSGPRIWAEAARRAAESLPGVMEFNTARLEDDFLALLAGHQAEIERATLFFEEGARLAEGQDDAVNTLATQVNELRRMAARVGRRLRITVTGHTDKSGPEEVNLRLSQQRAELIVGLLAARGVPTGVMTAAGSGSSVPRPDSVSEQEPAQNRRVTFRVMPDEAPPGATPP